jgi:hypothetical protein
VETWIGALLLGMLLGTWASFTGQLHRLKGVWSLFCSLIDWEKVEEISRQYPVKKDNKVVDSTPGS